MNDSSLNVLPVSHEKVPSRLFELGDEIRIFSSDKHFKEAILSIIFHD
jgi:hypothetical protein